MRGKPIQMAPGLAGPSAPHFGYPDPVEDFQAERRWMSFVCMLTLPSDETGLNYKALPTNTLASLSEKYAPGHKMQKQSVTVMMSANASGSIA